MPELKLAEIAKRISVHLKRFEADSEINKVGQGRRLKPYYFANTYVGGSRVCVRYVSFQGTSTLTKAEALRYLAWLDAGNVGSHYMMGNSDA